MTAGEYHDRLAVLGGEAINEYLALAASGTVPREKQDDASATYAAKLTDDDRRLDFAAAAQGGLQPASAASRRRPARIAFTAGNGSSCSPPSRADGSGRPGKSSARETARSPSPGGSAPSLVTALQAEGKPKTDADSYLRGNRVEKGSFFTDS